MDDGESIPNLILVPFGLGLLVTMGFVGLGGLISIFENEDKKELESSYGSQV